MSRQYSKKIEFVHYQYSGAVHDVIPGIVMVNLLHYNTKTDQSTPVDYRIYDKETDGKTKNEHFCDMLTLAKERGINPDAVVMDAWYSGLESLKHIGNLGWTWVSNLRKNRKVNHNVSLESLEIPDEGQKIHLRGYGWVTVFKFVAKNGHIDYITTNLENPTREQTEKIVKARWSIEFYHRELKQTCGIERCQARTGRAQRNHICLAVFAWLDMNKRRINKKITLYQQNWEVIKTSIQNNIRWLLADTQFC
ncbi:MAG: transposase [Rickettsia endosymbiont of Ixodes persulcatus]|nr:transposase [Rickettsia endosymbiont of Ixodes persulcatus]